MSNTDDFAIQQAATLLQAGQLVAIPTETVYGLAANAADEHACRKIFQVKGRPSDHPLIVLLPALSHLEHWAKDIPEQAYSLAQAFWPGPLTLILKCQEHVSRPITGNQQTIGLRIPAHPMALALLKVFDGAVAAPSANRFGHISPTTAAHVRAELGDAIAMVLDGGACAVGIESTIVDLSRLPATPAQILRSGKISATDIATVIDLPTPQYFRRDHTPDQAIPRTPGHLPSHYAPNTPLKLVSTPTLEALLEQGSLLANAAVLSYSLGSSSSIGSSPLRFWRQASPEANAFARDLYAMLRELDDSGMEIILVEAPPNEPEWQAINDRLQRAAAGSIPTVLS